MKITNHEATKLNDPTGIMIGDRYEFLLDIDVPDDDELYTEKGVELRVILAADDKGKRIVQYHFIEKQTANVLDFALEEEEEAEVLSYCAQYTD